GLPRPLTAPVVIERIDVIIPGNQGAAQQRLAGARRDVPPAFSSPAFGVLVAQSDADPARGVVAEAEVGGSRTAPQTGHGQRQHQTGGGTSKRKGARGIFSSHLMKLYQFLDDCAWADGGVNLLLRRDMAKSVTAPTCQKREMSGVVPLGNVR